MAKIRLPLITLLLIVVFSFGIMNLFNDSESYINQHSECQNLNENLASNTLMRVNTPLLYFPTFEPLNIKEEMTLSPMFTPDNALSIYKAWIDLANTSIEVQNQYITQFNDDVDWDNDPSPLVRSLVDAHERGVKIRVQVNEDSDSDDVTDYFIQKGIEVRWMGNSASSTDGWLSDTHNKLVIIDDKVTLLSSINFGENAFTNNREAGLVIQNTKVANYFKSIFSSDWDDGEIPPKSLVNKKSLNFKINQLSDSLSSYPSHTNIPHANFTGIYNVLLFTNPDNADEVIFQYLNTAQSSIYVSMYTISRPDFNETLINLKKANPSMNIEVLISYRRVGSTENRDTKAAAQSLVDNGIPVYNSTRDDDKVDGYYHAKYWIIDGKHVFIYSGNWSPRSVTPQLEVGDDSYTSSEGNRDMGVAVLDTSDIASFFKLEVWDKDVAVGDKWPPSSAIKTSDSVDSPFSWSILVISIVLLPFIRRKLK